VPVLPTASELLAVLPEIVLVTGMCIALVVPVLPPFRVACREGHGLIAGIGAVTIGLALLSAIALLGGWFGPQTPDRAVLGNMLVVDQFALAVKVILYLFSLGVLLMWRLITPDGVRTIDTPDYVTLILGGVLGMGLMASAANFLIIFLAIESASLPSYALAGFRKTTRRGSEASLKYVLFGAATSAVMVYGLSMLYGGYGTLDVATIARTVADEGMTLALALGLFGFMVGLGFKLSAVPMHFWCPDVFEGAPFEITTFLSVASKGGAIALLVRVMLVLGYFSGEEQRGTLIGIGGFVGLVGLLTATWGNLAAYFQDNVKRLLAYSSIAHAGYMIMAASLVTASMQYDGEAGGEGVAYAILFYLFVYAFMNLGAFTVAAYVARESGTESLDAYAGLGARNPALAIVFGVFLLSLFGMPTTGGFFGKVYIGFRMWEQGGWANVLVAGLVLNTVFSLYFYLKPIIIMVWKEPGSRPAIAPPTLVWALLGVAVAGVFLTGLAPDLSTGWARDNAVIAYEATIEVVAPFDADGDGGEAASLAPGGDADAVPPVFAADPPEPIEPALADAAANGEDR